MADEKPITIAARSVHQDRGAIIDHACEYATTDLLCYRVEDSPGLRERQQTVWQPLLQWASDSLGATLKVTQGVLFVKQPPEALSRLRQAVEKLDDRNLATLSVVTRVTGSLVIGLAVILGHIDAEAAFEASQLDENWQSEKWGEDEEDIRHRDALKAEISDAVEFMKSG
ncbi:MAG: ATPase [Rhodospirillales bacterium]|nr:ATPase [Rhodospirillales bacterium]